MNITIEEFKRLDIRIGEILKAERVENADRLLRLEVDFGPSTRSTSSGQAGSGSSKRQIVAGIAQWFDPEDLVGKKFPFIVNLEPKKIGPEGDYSQGMMLAGVEKLEKSVKVMDSETDEKPVLLNPSEKVPNGTKVR